MSNSRREFLKAVPLPGLALGLSGCLSFQPDISSPEIKFSGNISTSEPVLSQPVLSTENTYPVVRSELLSSNDLEEAIRWKYLEKEIPQIVDELHEYDTSNNSLIVSGSILPSDKKLKPRNLYFDDEDLHVVYGIVNRPSGSPQKLLVNTQFQYSKGHIGQEEISTHLIFDG